MPMKERPRLSWKSFLPMGLSPEKVAELFRERAAAEAATFAEHLAIIDQAVVRTHPLSLLSSFSTYFLTSLARSKEIEEGIEMAQPHGEILQSVLLRHSWNEFATEEHPSMV